MQYDDENKGLTLSEKLKKLRIAKHVTLKEMSIDTGITINTLSKYMTGAINPTVYRVAVLAAYFNVDVDYLIGREKN